MKTETANTLCPICGGKMDFKHVMNTGDSGTNKTTIFLEYMNEIYVDRDFYSRGKIIEMAKDKYVELHGNVNNDEELKDTIVSIIKQRIESEYRKHPDLGWAEIAARKIYARFFENKK